MPIYEYQCQQCGHGLEALQKISDSALQDCPECGKPTLKKRVSAVAFRLKGGGWYETDFKTGDKKNLAAGSDSDSSSDKAGSSKADSSKADSSKAGGSKTDSSKTGGSKAGSSKESKQPAQ